MAAHTSVKFESSDYFPPEDRSRLPSLAELGLDVYLRRDGAGHHTSFTPPLGYDNRVHQETSRSQSRRRGEGGGRDAVSPHYVPSPPSTSRASPTSYSSPTSRNTYAACTDSDWPKAEPPAKHSPKATQPDDPPHGSYHPRNCPCQWCAQAMPPSATDHQGTLPDLSIENSARGPGSTNPIDASETQRYTRPQLVEALRRDLGLPQDAPLSLSSISDPGPDYRPTFSYMLLVQVAILESPLQKLTLQGIYEAMENRFAWCRNNTVWKESIRHMLTLRAEFEHISREEAACFPGKGSFWRLTGLVGLTRPRRRGPRPAGAASGVIGSSGSDRFRHVDPRPMVGPPPLSPSQAPPATPNSVADSDLTSPPLTPPDPSPGLGGFRVIRPADQVMDTSSG